jgi:phosphoglycerol geranylgeranyltransferase
MEVKKYIDTKLSNSAVHVTLIDPSRQAPEAAGRLAETAQEVGSDLIFVGGSSGVTQRTLSETAEAVKERASIPVLYFPTGTDSISLNLRCIFVFKPAEFTQLTVCQWNPVKGGIFAETA